MTSFHLTIYRRFSQRSRSRESKALFRTPVGAGGLGPSESAEPLLGSTVLLVTAAAPFRVADVNGDEGGCAPEGDEDEGEEEDLALPVATSLTQA